MKHTGNILNLSTAIRFGLILILPALYFGCSPTAQVFSDYDRTANIEQYRTFGWSPYDDIEARNNPIYYNELNDKRIKIVVGEQLESRGYTFSADKPELLIHYHIVIENKTAVRTDPYGHFYGPYWTRTQVNVYQYREGTLIIDLMDASTNSLVWRGWMTSFMRNINPDQLEIKIREAVQLIFTKYPYHAHSNNEEIE